MTVTVYQSTDASAPSLTGATGSLIAVLDACLVNGYGAKSAAGWSKAFTGTNLAAYRAASGNQYYLAVDDSGGSGANFARISGYTAMTSVTAGTGQFPFPAQVAGGLYVQKSSTVDSTVRAWVLVTNGTMVYFFPEIAATVGAWAGTTNTGSGNGQFCFGDFTSYRPSDSYNTLIMASATTTASNGVLGTKIISINSTLTASVGHYLARAFTQFTQGMGFAKCVPGDYSYSVATIAGSGNTQLPTFPDPVTGGILTSPIEILEGSLSMSNYIVRGKLPGLWAPLHALPGAQGDTFSGAGDLAGKTFMFVNAYSLATTGRMFIETSNTW